MWGLKERFTYLVRGLCFIAMLTGINEDISLMANQRPSLWSKHWPVVDFGDVIWCGQTTVERCCCAPRGCSHILVSERMNQLL
jgi:hypothetical protein